MRLRPACRRRWSVYRALNLPRGSREVLGLDLNCSESTGTGHSFPYLQKARSPHDEGICAVRPLGLSPSAPSPPPERSKESARIVSRPSASLPRFALQL